MCCHQKCFAGEKKVSHLVYHKNSPERCTGPRGRYGIVYSPLSPFKNDNKLQSLLRREIFTVNCSSTTLFLFFYKLPSWISHITRLKFNNTIAMFSTKLNYSHSIFKGKVYFIHNQVRYVNSPPPNKCHILYCFQMNRKELNLLNQIFVI